MAQVLRKPTFPDHIIKKIISKFEKEVEDEVYPVSTGIYTQQKLVNLWQAIPKPLLADYDDKIFFQTIQNQGICTLTSCPNCLVDFTNKYKPVCCHFCSKWYCEDCICHRKRLHPMDNNPNGPRYSICYDCDGKYLLLQLNHSYVQNRMLIQLAIVEISKDLELIEQKLEFQNKRIRSSRSQPKTKLNMKQSIMKKQELDLKKNIKKHQWEIQNEKDKRTKLQVKLRELRIQQRKSIQISEQQKQQRLVRLKKMQEEEEQRKKRQKLFYQELEKQKQLERRELQKQIQRERQLEQIERQKQKQRQIQIQREKEIQRQKQRQKQIANQLERYRQRQIELQREKEQYRLKLIRQQEERKREEEIQKKRQIQRQKVLEKERQLQKLEQEREREKQRFKELERLRQIEKDKEKEREKQKERLRKAELEKQRERERIQQQKRLQKQKEEKQKQEKNGKDLEVTFQTHRNQTEGTIQNSHRNSYVYNQFKNYFTEDMQSEVSRSQSEISVNTQKKPVSEIDKKQKENLFNELKKKLEESQKKETEQTEQIDNIRAELLRSAAKKQKYWESNKQQQGQQTYIAPAQKCKCTIF